MIRGLAGKAAHPRENKRPGKGSTLKAQKWSGSRFLK